MARATPTPPAPSPVLPDGLADGVLKERIQGIMAAIDAKTRGKGAAATIDIKTIGAELDELAHTLEHAQQPDGAVAMSGRQLHVMLLVQCGHQLDACNELQSMLVHAQGRQLDQVRLHLAILLAQLHLSDRLDEMLRQATGDASIKPEALADVQVLDTEAHTQVGHPFFPFSFSDLDGHSHELKDYHGHVLLLHLFITGGGILKAEEPKLLALNQRYHSQGLELLGLDGDPNPRLAAAALASMPWPQVGAHMVWKALNSGPFGSKKLPTTYLIGLDGVLLAAMGSVSEHPELVDQAMQQLKSR